VVVIVVTIAADYPGISEWGKPVGAYLSGVTDMNLPSRQPVGNEPAKVLSGW